MININFGNFGMNQNSQQEFTQMYEMCRQHTECNNCPASLQDNVMIGNSTFICETDKWKKQKGGVK